MTLKSSIRCILTLATLGFSVFAHSQAALQKNSFTIESDTVNEEVTGVKLDPSPIAQQDKNFTFDWNEHITIALNKNKINDEEKFLSEIDDVSQLSLEDQEALGRLLSKLGSYYAHVMMEPDLAINKLTIANTFLKNKNDKAWNDSHLAYAYEQKYAILGQPENKEKALYYVNKITSELFPETKNFTVAFAYNIKAALKNDDTEYPDAEKYLTSALAIYEAFPGPKNDQYAKTKNSLAATLLLQEGKDQAAINLLNESKQYWVKKGKLYENPFAAKNLTVLGQAYLKTDKSKAACGELLMAINIYKNVYGSNSPFLVQPYQLLAQAYQKLGKTHQAAAYKQKAKRLYMA